VHVRGTASLARSLSLEGAIPEGAVQLSARLIGAESGARMESYLTALPGRYALRAAFGGPTTGVFLTLDVGPDATMTVLPASSPTAEKPPPVPTDLAQRPAPAHVGRHLVSGSGPPAPAAPPGVRSCVNDLVATTPPDRSHCSRVGSG
jgi:hypothetical protein